MNTHFQIFGAACLLSLLPACVPMRKGALPTSDPPLPAAYPLAGGAKSSALVGWREYFKDPNLTALISTALSNNQELNILLQEVSVSKSEVLARKGAIFPFISFGGGAGLDKAARHTRDGAVEENAANEIKTDKKIPSPLPNFAVGPVFEWEVDIWRKLRNERDAAVLRYLATQEGQNFMVTNIVSEIAQTYYELLALDSQMAILKPMIEIQQAALKAVKLQKEAAKVTELAVKRFEAEVLKNQSRLYEVQQQVTVTENRLNYLAGRYPQRVRRNSAGFEHRTLSGIHGGLPVELLRNRPDVRKAELELVASGLEVKAAAARFYPSLNISAALGLRAFSLDKAFNTPASMAYEAAAGMMAPLINRSEIKAAYNGASARQIGAIYTYQQTVLKAYIEVVNQLSQIKNLDQSYALKSQQVQALSDSIAIAGQLFTNARAEYTEVLLTQREALESKMELVELKQQQLNAFVKAYKALGGGYNRTAGGPNGITSMSVPRSAGKLRADS